MYQLNVFGLQNLVTNTRVVLHIVVCFSRNYTLLAAVKLQLCVLAVHKIK